MGWGGRLLERSPPNPSVHRTAAAESDCEFGVTVPPRPVTLLFGERSRPVRRDVRSFIEESVPDGFADKVASLVRPCVTAQSQRCDDGTIPVGGSKFGGRPDVPRGFEWPMAGDNPCWFVAQVQLADLRPFDTGFRLPRTGLLSFFYHDDGGTAGRKSRVFFFSGGRLRRIDLVPDQRYGGHEFLDEHFPSRSFRFTQGYCLPADPSQFKLTARERVQWVRSDVFDFKAAFNERFASGDHQYFGQPTYWSDGTPPRGYQLVACIGLVNDQYYYFVPEGSVEKLDFSKLRVVYECS
jgi:Domain of unknown function (DUF1963)